MEEHRFSSNYVLHIDEGETSESADAVYYRISREGKTVVSSSFLGGKAEIGDAKGAFVFLATTRDQLFAFALVRNPKEVAILFDAQTGDSWPRAHGDELPEQTQRRGDAMLRRITGSGLHELTLHRY